MTFKIIMALKTKIRLVGCKSCIVVYRYQCIRTCYRLYQVDKYSRCFQNVVTHLPKFIVSDCNLKKECQTFHCCAYRRMLVHSCYHHQQCYTKLFSIDKKKICKSSKDIHATTCATLSKEGCQQNQEHFVLQFAQIYSSELSYYPKHQKCTSTVVGFIIRRSYSLIYGSFAPTASNSGRWGLIARHFASAYRPK